MPTTSQVLFLISARTVRLCIVVVVVDDDDDDGRSFASSSRWVVPAARLSH
jgi:hypothetical protein